MSEHSIREAFEEAKRQGLHDRFKNPLGGKLELDPQLDILGRIVNTLANAGDSCELQGANDEQIEVENSVYEAGRQEALQSTCISSAETRRARGITDEELAAMLDESNTDAAYSPAERIALACLPEDSGREEARTFWEPFDADQTDDTDWLEGFVHGMRERE